MWVAQRYPGEISWDEEKVYIPWGRYKMLGMSGHRDLFNFGGEYPWLGGYHDPENMTWVSGVLVTDAFGPGKPRDWVEDLEFCTQFVPVVRRPVLSENLKEERPMPREILVLCWQQSVSAPGGWELEWDEWVSG